MRGARLKPSAQEPDVYHQPRQYVQELRSGRFADPVQAPAWGQGLMRFPWQRQLSNDPTPVLEVADDDPPRATRQQSGGDFSDAVVRLIEQTAAGNTADTRSTAATESAAGALSRAFASATVVGPPWVQQAVSPVFLAQVGRDLVRGGDSMHVLRVNDMGKAVLLPCSSWHFEGDADPDTWMVRATVFGPSSSQTWLLPYASVIFVKWGSDPGTPYVGVAPSSYAATTNRMLTSTQKTLADESGGPLANLLVTPQDGGDGDEDTDPLAARTYPPTSSPVTTGWSATAP